MTKLNYKASDGKNVWEVDTIKLTCTCPDYRFRRAKVGGFCKHILDFLKKINNGELDYKSIIEKDNDAVIFTDRYGEEILDMLKAKGDIYEKAGKLFYLD